MNIDDDELKKQIWEQSLKEIELLRKENEELKQLIKGLTTIIEGLRPKT